MSRRQFALFAIISVLLMSVLLFVQEVQTVFANKTQRLCDSNQKYYCSRVNYVAYGSGWKINKRQFWGGYGQNAPGQTLGADEWRLWFSRDWQYINGDWQIRWECRGSCDQWHSNPLPGVEGPFNVGPTGDPGGLRNYNTVVQFQHQYYQHNPSRVYCQGIEEHTLANGESYLRPELTDCN